MSMAVGAVKCLESNISCFTNGKTYKVFKKSELYGSIYKYYIIMDDSDSFWAWNEDIGDSTDYAYYINKWLKDNNYGVVVKNIPCRVCSNYWEYYYYNNFSINELLGLLKVVKGINTKISEQQILAIENILNELGGK